MSEKPRELTRDEVQDEFLTHVWSLVDYWNTTQGAANQRDRLEGLAFSIMSVLDGDACALPRFIVAADPHPEDKAYQRGEGENWYPSNGKAHVNADISGELHERFLNHTARKGR